MKKYPFSKKAVQAALAAVIALSPVVTTVAVNPVQVEAADFSSVTTLEAYIKNIYSKLDSTGLVAVENTRAELIKVDWASYAAVISKNNNPKEQAIIADFLEIAVSVTSATNLTAKFEEFKSEHRDNVREIFGQETSVDDVVSALARTQTTLLNNLKENPSIDFTNAVIAALVIEDGNSDVISKFTNLVKVAETKTAINEILTKVDGNKATREALKRALTKVDPVSGGGGAAPAPTVPTPEEVIKSYPDVAKHWAQAELVKGVQLGWIKGYTDNTIKPNNPITRAEFVTILVRALGLKDAASLSFKDADKIGAWAKDSIAAAVKAGLIKGDDAGNFRPTAEISRAEMAMIAARALKIDVDAASTTGFADDKDIPAWAKGAVKALSDKDIIKGKTGNQFDSVADSSRAEAVTVLLRMLEK